MGPNVKKIPKCPNSAILSFGPTFNINNSSDMAEQIAALKLC